MAYLHCPKRVKLYNFSCLSQLLAKEKTVPNPKSKPNPNCSLLGEQEDVAECPIMCRPWR